MYIFNSPLKCTEQVGLSSNAFQLYSGSTWFEFQPVPPAILSEAFHAVCPTRYRTRHFFNNSDTNEDIAMKFGQEYIRCVRNEEECVCVCL